jgi:hypothetical protein
MSTRVRGVIASSITLGAASPRPAAAHLWLRVNAKKLVGKIRGSGIDDLPEVTGLGLGR